MVKEIVYTVETKCEDCEFQDISNLIIDTDKYCEKLKQCPHCNSKNIGFDIYETDYNDVFSQDEIVDKATDIGIDKGWYDENCVWSSPENRSEAYDLAGEELLLEEAKK